MTARCPRRARAGAQRDLEHPVDLVGVVHGLLEGHPTAVAAGRTALVQPAHVVAHDQDVDALDAFRPHDRRIGEGRERSDRHELAIQLEVGPQLVDEAAADGARQHWRTEREDVVEEGRHGVVEHPAVRPR